MPTALPTTAPPQPTAPLPSAIPLRKRPNLPPGFESWWVANFEETVLWSGPRAGSASLGKMDQFRQFMVVAPQTGARLSVWSPESGQTGYLDAAVLGPTGPSIWMSGSLPRVDGRIQIPSRTYGDKTYIRKLPLYASETKLRKAPANTAIAVREPVVAADGTLWYSVGDGEYVLAGEVKLPPPVERTLPGRWIDVDLGEPAMVTAYEGDKIVYTALAIKGTVAASTQKGTFSILRRLENETMNSETLLKPVPRDAPGGYYLKNVLYTQYFTPDGASLHYNYWLGTFGYAGSHGCLGMNLVDARWFWDWATVGTAVVIR